MSRTRRSENRTIRPFSGLAELEELFLKPRLNVSNNIFEPGAIVLDETEFKAATYSLDLGFSLKELRSAVESAGIPFVDTALVCLSKGRTLKTMHTQFIRPLRSQDFPSQIEIEIEQNPLVYRDQAGFKITLAIVLIRNLPKKPLRPSLAGTWLGQSKFSVSPESDHFIFSPTKLTDQIREAESLPKQTLSFIKIKGEDLLNEEDLQKIITVFLDADVLSYIQQDESDPLSEQIIRSLVHETLYQILYMVCLKLREKSDILDVTDLTDGSGAKNLLQKVSQLIDINPSQLLEYLNEKPSLASALIQSSLGMRKSAINGYRKSESL